MEMLLIGGVLLGALGAGIWLAVKYGEKKATAEFHKGRSDHVEQASSRKRRVGLDDELRNRLRDERTR